MEVLDILGEGVFQHERDRLVSLGGANLAELDLLEHDLISGHHDHRLLALSFLGTQDTVLDAVFV